MRTAVLIFVFTMLGVLTGCASEPSKNYAAYVQKVADSNAAQTAQREALEKSLDAQAAKCTTDACTIAIAGFRAMASMGGGGNQPMQIAPPAPEPSFLDRTIQLIGAFSPIAADVVQYKAVVENNKTTRQQASTNAQVQIANTNAWSNAVTAIGSRPTTSTTIGGDYVGGDKINNTGTYNTGSGNRFESPNTNTGGAAANCPGGTSGAGGSSATGGAGGTGATSPGGTTGSGAASGSGGASNCVGGSAG